MSTLSDDLRTLSYEATLYFHPLVTMDVTRLQAATVRPGPIREPGHPTSFIT